MAKNQHWLPQFYLRPFRANKEPALPRVWTFFRDGPEEPRLMAIEEVAARRYLYSPGRVGESRNHDVDRRLQDLESLLGSIWPEVAGGCVDLEADAVRKALALFVATLYRRHPQRIADIARIHDSLVEGIDAWLEDGTSTPAVAPAVLPGKTLAFDYSQWKAFRQAGTLDHSLTFADSILSGSGDIAAMLLDRRFAIAVADQPAFATCDAPVVLSNAHRQHFGFRTKGTTVHLPLSPTRFLIIEDSTLARIIHEGDIGVQSRVESARLC